MGYLAAAVNQLASLVGDETWPDEWMDMDHPYLANFHHLHEGDDATWMHADNHPSPNTRTPWRCGFCTHQNP
jgi:hypothetical protein